MSLFDRIFKKVTVLEDDPEFLRSKVIYNTKENFIVLVSYGSDHFYEVMDFINTLQALPQNNKIISLLSHTAMEKELTKEESEGFDKKPVKIIDNRYYLLLSGRVEAYAILFDYIDQSNKVLEEILKDIYQYCSTAAFRNLIDLGVISESKFVYKKIVPQYHEKCVFDNTISMNSGYYDDIDYITNQLPKSYDFVDISKIINVYFGSGDNKTKRSVYNMIKLCEEFDESSDNTAIAYNYALVKLFLKENILLCKFMDQPSIETLSVITAPIYMREDSDTEGKLNGDLPIDQLDEIFQQEYDRFTNPTADAAVEYEDIDEKLASDEESNNMRPEDIAE